MLSIIFKSRIALVIFLFYIFLLIWWFRIFLTGIRETDENYLFGFIYAIIALVGSVNGLFIARKWGGIRSYIGRGLIFFSFGLLGEWFGQTIWSYYNLIARVEIPYPSIADIGYFSIIPLYGIGMYYFAKASGVKFTLRTINGKLTVILLPIIMVGISYVLFLKNLTPDFSSKLRTFLDFGYPLGEAITISIALVTFVLSSNILGGQMRKLILFLIFALLVQYISDYSFLYQAAEGSYYNAGIVDLLYVHSFTIMSFGLIQFEILFNKIENIEQNSTESAKNTKNNNYS